MARRGLATIALALSLLLAVPLAAASAAGEGLRITPVRQFLTAEAGGTARGSFSVANLTAKPLPVTFSVQQFSVADYTYDYLFDTPENDWLRLEQTSATLEPGQSQEVSFAFNVPADARPGGYYYTLLASANLSSQGLSGTIQAADLLYVTVNGELTRTNRLDGSSIRRLSFGRDIPFTVQPINTGNIHQFVFVTGELDGLSARQPVTSGAHLLMPGKARTLTGSIPAPVLPGMYRATIGYKTDDGQTVTESRMIVVVPLWFIAALLGALLILGGFLSRRRRKLNSANQSENTEQQKK